MKKKLAILEYVKNNPEATNAEVSKACGTHITYTAHIRRNEGVKTPKEKPDLDSKQSGWSSREIDMLKRISELREENAEIKDALIRMDGVIKYLENKLRDGAPV